MADLLADLRVYGLPDDYWDSFRTMIRKVSVNDALTAAKAYIHPESLVIVVVGTAAEIVPQLEKYGPVRVVDAEGKQLRSGAQPAESAKPATQESPAKGKQPAAKPAPSAPAPATP